VTTPQEPPPPAASAAPPIVTRGLTKRFRGGQVAVDTVDLEVPAGSVFGFLGWMYVLELPVVLAVVWLRRKDVVVAIGSHWRYGLLAGLCGVTGYSLVVYATLFVPLSIVSALRETSVIMAALIGTVLLGERPWQDRVAASSLVAGGVALMTVYR